MNVRPVLNDCIRFTNKPSLPTPSCSPGLSHKTAGTKTPEVLVLQQTNCTGSQNLLGIRKGKQPFNTQQPGS